MKAFGIGVAVAIVLPIGAAIALNFIQETVAQAYSTEATRLDQQENVNDYGRERKVFSKLKFSDGNNANRGPQNCCRQSAGGFHDGLRHHGLAADHRLDHSDRIAYSRPDRRRNAAAPDPNHVWPRDNRRAGGGGVREAAAAVPHRAESRHALRARPRDRCPSRWLAPHADLPKPARGGAVSSRPRFHLALLADQLARRAGARSRRSRHRRVSIPFMITRVFI